MSWGKLCLGFHSCWCKFLTWRHPADSAHISYKSIKYNYISNDLEHNCEVSGPVTWNEIYFLLTPCAGREQGSWGRGDSMCREGAGQLRVGHVLVSYLRVSQSLRSLSANLSRQLLDESSLNVKASWREFIQRLSPPKVDQTIFVKYRYHQS